MRGVALRIQTAARLLRTVRHLRPRQVAFRIMRRGPFRRVPWMLGYAPWNRLRRWLSAYSPTRSGSAERSGFSSGVFSAAPESEGRISTAGIELDGRVSPSSPAAWNDASRFRLYRLHSHSFLTNSRNDPATEAWFLTEAITFLAGDRPGHRRSRQTAWEPHPVALRIINWVRWAARAEREAPAGSAFEGALHYHAQWLGSHVEWETDGNHLIDNAAALVLAGWYLGKIGSTQGNQVLQRGLRIMLKVLPRQVLRDGFHNERSPMYHSLVTERVLDVLAAVQNVRGRGPLASDSEARDLLRRYATLLVGWTWEHPDPPPINDAFHGIAASRQEILRYAASLGITPSAPSVDGAATRIHDVTRGPFRVVFDMDEIGPEHVPGHAHADTLQVLLWCEGTAVLTDTGTSTYDEGSRRDYERGTVAHNTVVVGNESSSEMWGTFRVGRRAHISDARVEENTSDRWHGIATHDGYRHRGVYHERAVLVSSSRVVVRDQLSAPGASSTPRASRAPQPRTASRTPTVPATPSPSCAYFHFNAGTTVAGATPTEIVTDTVRIRFQSSRGYRLERTTTEESVGFEKRGERVTIAVHFDSDLETIIEPRHS